MENSAYTDGAVAAPQGLHWTDALNTGDARMDDTHQEFVTLLNELLQTPPERQLSLYRAFIEHTVAHFAQEERWMGRGPGRVVPAARRQHGRRPGPAPEGRGLRHPHRDPGRPRQGSPGFHEWLRQRELQLSGYGAGGALAWPTR
ncbi:MAG: hypothetical protein MUF55_03625 [Hydrogenophaga sp.]|nr:hypothetical protein [Hydrogenophaga sp.]